MVVVVKWWRAWRSTGRHGGSLGKLFGGALAMQIGANIAHLHSFYKPRKWIL